MGVKFRYCPLFAETFERHRDIAAKLKAFMDAKAKDPTAQFGSKDASFHGEGVLNRAVPKLRHAHLTHDISILYTLGGRDPVVINLFGVFTHDESGTGMPANIKRQKKLASRLTKQVFDNTAS